MNATLQIGLVMYHYFCPHLAPDHDHVPRHNIKLSHDSWWKVLWLIKVGQEWCRKSIFWVEGDLVDTVYITIIFALTADRYVVIRIVFRIHCLQIVRNLRKLEFICTIGAIKKRRCGIPSVYLINTQKNTWLSDAISIVVICRTIQSEQCRRKGTASSEIGLPWSWLTVLLQILRIWIAVS